MDGLGGMVGCGNVPGGSRRLGVLLIPLDCVLMEYLALLVVVVRLPL